MPVLMHVPLFWQGPTRGERRGREAAVELGQLNLGSRLSDTDAALRDKGQAGSARTWDNRKQKTGHWERERRDTERETEE